MEDEKRQAAEAAGKPKVMLVARIDQRAIPALDRVANANEVNTAQLMGRFLNDISTVGAYPVHPASLRIHDIANASPLGAVLHHLPCPMPVDSLSTF